MVLSRQSFVGGPVYRGVCRVGPPIRSVATNRPASATAGRPPAVRGGRRRATAFVAGRSRGGRAHRRRRTRRPDRRPHDRYRGERVVRHGDVGRSLRRPSTRPPGRGADDRLRGQALASRIAPGRAEPSRSARQLTPAGEPLCGKRASTEPRHRKGKQLTCCSQDCRTDRPLE